MSESEARIVNRIVVGVDGSAPSVAALTWAVSEASCHDAVLVAVTAWDLPLGIAGEAGALTVGALADELPAEARRQQDEALSAVPHDGVEVERVVEYGSPARVLLAQAENADLLVVGARGHGGFVGLLIGSVSQQCATHAVCPTVIVPPPAD